MSWTATKTLTGNAVYHITNETIRGLIEIFHAARCQPGIDRVVANRDFISDSLERGLSDRTLSEVFVWIHREGAASPYGFALRVEYDREGKGVIDFPVADVKAGIVRDQVQGVSADIFFKSNKDGAYTRHNGQRSQSEPGRAQTHVGSYAFNELGVDVFVFR